MAHFKGTENKDVRCPHGPVSPAEVRFRLFSPGSAVPGDGGAKLAARLPETDLWKILILFNRKNTLAVKYQ